MTSGAESVDADATCGEATSAVVRAFAARGAFGVCAGAAVGVGVVVVVVLEPAESALVAPASCAEAVDETAARRPNAAKSVSTLGTVRDRLLVEVIVCS
jgi:hypothetical protein